MAKMISASMLSRVRDLSCTRFICKVEEEQVKQVNMNSAEHIMHINPALVCK